MITVSATVLHSAVLVLYINVMLDRLLQRCASWRTVQHCSETAASSEQRSLDCAPSAEAFPRQAVTAPAALVASPAADHIQFGSSDI